MSSATCENQTISEFAAKWKLAEQTVRGHLHFRRYGLFPTHAGGRVLISPEAEAAFLKASAEAAAKPTKRGKAVA